MLKGFYEYLVLRKLNVTVEVEEDDKILNVVRRIVEYAEAQEEWSRITAETTGANDIDVGYPLVFLELRSDSFTDIVLYVAFVVEAEIKKRNLTIENYKDMYQSLIEGPMNNTKQQHTWWYHKLFS
jgi:hypothetical protein